jgi:DNA-binding CsgD family transcriptional regulator/tetratricopeptide (TPR) repeat protein
VPAPDTERFFGRADALAALEDAYASAVRGHPALVLVTGDAGIGKSTLVARFTASKAEARVLRGGCFGLVSTELPYGPVVQALRPLADDRDRGALSVDSTTLCAELGGDVAAVGETSRWSQGRLFESTLRLLGDLARRQPLVVVLEDLHWADRATLDLLLFVLGNLVTERILLVLTSRGDEPDAPPWLEEGMQRLTRTPRSRVLELGPLADADAEELVADIAGRAPDADAVRRVVERAEGNPLFLTELAGTATGPAAAVPRRLRDLLLLRLQRLSPGGRQLVHLLAAATTPLDVQLAIRVLGTALPDPRGAVAEAYEARLVGEDDEGRLRLRHALLGEALYAAMPPTDRLAAHELLASAMDDERSDDAAAIVAYHWEHAGRADRVPEPLVRAARSAASCFAFTEAASAWQRLLGLFDRVPDACAPTGLDRPAVLVELARAHRFGPTPERSVHALEEAIALLTDDAERRALASENLARQLMDLGRLDEALRAVEAAVELAGASAVRVRARVEATYAAVLMIRGEYELSRQRVGRALVLVPEGTDSWERSHALCVLGVDLVNQGDVTGALEALDEAMAISRRLGDAEAVLRDHVNLVYVLEVVGRYREAVRIADEGLLHAERENLYAVAGTPLLANKGSALIALGELRAAREPLLEAAERRGETAWLQYTRLRLAEVEVSLGALESADRLMAEAATADVSTDSVVQTQFRLVHALLALARGKPDEAYAAAAAELDRSDGGTEPVVGLHLYALGLRALALLGAAHGSVSDELAVRAGELVKAAGVLRDQAPLAPCQELHDLCALEYRDCLGIVEVEEWEDLAERLLSGRAGLAPYAWYRAATARLAQEGRRAAWAPLTRAWRLLEPLGDVPLRREVAALAATCRLDLGAPERPAEPGPAPFGLTRRELEVLALVCDGATNRQIARTLEISERTAGVHVSNILAKLHARNRAEAIAVAHRTGALATSS